MRGRVDYQSMNYRGYDGSLTNVLLALDWRFATSWNTGVGYRFVDYRLDSTNDKFRGQVNYKFNGPTVFIGATF